MKNNKSQKNIPSGWREVRLGNCLLQKPDYGVNAPAVKFSLSLPTYIRITDISDDGKFLPDKKTSVNQNDLEDYILNQGDIVFARTGASVGKTYLYNKDDGQLVFAGFLIRVKTNKYKLTPYFLSAYTHTEEYWKWVGEISARSGQPGINSSEYSSLPFLLPPLSEQQRIVAVLETWDQAIEKLVRKIKVKKNIKKGLMQNLLTGKTRLAGFEKEWKNEKLGDIGEIVSGGTPDTTEKSYWGGDIQWITPTEITKLKGKYIYSSGRTISKLGLKNSSATIIPKKSLIVCSRATVGDCAINLVDITTNQGFKNIIPRKVQVDFLYYWMLTKKHYLKRIASGSTFLEFSKKDLEKIKINIPSDIKEQEAIANILNTADKEIEILENKFTILKDQKKYLLNSLITGKIRTPEKLSVK